MSIELQKGKNLNYKTYILYMRKVEILYNLKNKYKGGIQNEYES